MSSCLTPRELASWETGSLDRMKRRDLTDHIIGCESCFRIVESLHSLLAEPSGDTCMVAVEPIRHREPQRRSAWKAVRAIASHVIAFLLGVSILLNGDTGTSPRNSPPPVRIPVVVPHLSTSIGTVASPGSCPACDTEFIRCEPRQRWHAGRDDSPTAAATLGASAEAPADSQPAAPPSEPTLPTAASPPDTRDPFFATVEMPLLDDLRPAVPTEGAPAMTRSASPIISPAIEIVWQPTPSSCNCRCNEEGLR